MERRFSRQAECDLETLGDYIAQDSPLRALSFIAELRDKRLTLAELAEAFPLVPRYERHGVRRRAHGAYLIFSRIEADAITVLHVLHGAQDYAAIPFET